MQRLLLHIFNISFHTFELFKIIIAKGFEIAGEYTGNSLRFMSLLMFLFWNLNEVVSIYFELVAEVEQWHRRLIFESTE